MTAFALGQLLPEQQRPFPMDMIHINDTRSDIVPNAGIVSNYVAFAWLRCVYSDFLMLDLQILHAQCHTPGQTQYSILCL